MDSNMNSTLAATEGEEQFPLYFGNYEALKSIGKGKFAVVYRARKVGDDNIVALKRISVDMIDEKAREKCLKEVRLLQSLDHPNIIRYMDSFISENNLMIVYEWAAAGDLKRQLRKAQERGVGFEERVIWKYFSQICNAMQHMHERRIMHRDLKPANIFLTLDGTIKVGDLGLSRELSEHTIQAHSKVGTPLYMSPEVLKGDGYDFKSDIWSLGCLLYELAMLKSPFKSEGLNLYSLFQKISNGDFQPLPDNYSEELRSLVYGMISTRPQDRPEISYVCNVAQRMRTATNDKKQKSKSNLLAGSSSTASLSAPNDVTQDFNALGENKESEKKEIESKIIGIAAMEIDAVLEKKTATESESIVTSERKKVLINRISAVDSKTESKFEVEQNARRYEQSASENRSEGNGGWKNAVGPNGSKSYLPGREKTELPTSTHSDLSDDETLPIEKEKQFKVGGEIDVDKRFTRNGESEYYNGNGNDLNRFAAINRDVNYSNGIDKQKVFNNKFNGFDRNVSNNARTETIVDNTTSYPDAVNAREDTRSVIRRPKSANKNPGSDRPPKISQSNGVTTVGGNSDFNKPPLEKETSFSNTGSNHGFASSTKRLDSATSRKKLADSLLNASPAFAVMEEVYGKLVLLGFPMKDPGTSSNIAEKKSLGRLLPIHFACDLNAFNSVAGHGFGYQFMQFQSFVAVVVWLCTMKLGGQAEKEAMKIDANQDSPAMIAKQILRILQLVLSSDPSIDLSEITPTSLTHGFGIQVCNVLNALSNAAIEKITSELSKASNNRVYPTAIDDPIEVDSDDEKDNIEEDFLDSVNKNGNDVDSPDIEEFHAISGSDGPSPILASYIDPVIWREETERVATQLRSLAASSSSAGSQSGWGQHLTTLVTISKSVFPAHGMEDGVVTTTKSDAQKADTDNSVVLAQKMAQFQLYIEETINKIKTSERIVNKIESLTNLGLSYSQFKEELSGLELKQGEHQKVLDRLTSELSEIEEKQEEAVVVLQDKMGTHGGDSSGNGGTVRLKEAIQRIKKEIKEMSMTEQLLSNFLLHERIALTKLALSSKRVSNHRSLGRKGAKISLDGGSGRKFDTEDEELFQSFDQN